MTAFDFELVGKIGSMALIRKEDNDINYNIFSRISSELKPGMIWVSSGATEIGRLDYLKRNGEPLAGDPEQIKADYAAQGQAILMQNYRQFIAPKYSVRQLLVEHQHFNEKEKREHIKTLLLRCMEQNAIPIVNYNDAVSNEENRKMELTQLRACSDDDIVECIDNDETASVIATLVNPRYLVILTSVLGIYEDPTDEKTIVNEITGKDIHELIANIEELQKSCIGSSRPGANGAKAKLEYIKKPVENGTTVIIGHAKYKLKDLIEGTVPRTIIRPR